MTSCLEVIVFKEYLWHSNTSRRDVTRYVGVVTRGLHAFTITCTFIVQSREVKCVRKKKKKIRFSIRKSKQSRISFLYFFKIKK
ncbi:hypothetical protein PUN28_005893 [Cardiocondyla obscurior]|uniref:Uncharacterized protein n=1 Tax=Cardiocondyla obscurior TaxID=286306 RepID=A0AAW2G9U1_9HYME